MSNSPRTNRILLTAFLVLTPVLTIGYMASEASLWPLAFWAVCYSAIWGAVFAWRLEHLPKSFFANTFFRKAHRPVHQQPR